MEDLRRRQDNLISELERFESSGDEEVDAALRAGIKDRFAAIAVESEPSRTSSPLPPRRHAAAPVDPSILDRLPLSAVDLDRLPEERRRALYDAFRLELRFKRLCAAVNQIDIGCRLFTLVDRFGAGM